MIYIKNDITGTILAGEVANSDMLYDGYIEYHGAIPDIGEYQYYKLVNDELVVVNDNANYFNAISKEIQKLLDNKAIEFRYDNMLSARSAAGIPLSGSESQTEIDMHNEAISLARWYLSCWSKASNIEQDIINSVIIRPTIREVIDQMPIYS